MPVALKSSTIARAPPAPMSATDQSNPPEEAVSRYFANVLRSSRGASVQPCMILDRLTPLSPVGRLRAPSQSLRLNLAFAAALAERARVRVRSRTPQA